MKVDRAYDAAYREHAKHVWAIVYRMTGSAQDADDLVQDTFVRAMVGNFSTAREGDLRPWLARIAVNAGIDLLRQRRRRAYMGPWLPEPIDTGDAASEPPAPGADRGYDLLESASFAFLVALEALAPRARAVLLLRDVFDYSVREVADVLAMTDSHVKVTHHRARQIMTTYDQSRCVPARELQSRTRAVLEALMARFVAHDVAGLERLLAESVRTVSDSAGEYLAARVPIVGREKVALFWMKTTQWFSGARIDVRMLNGLPAVVVVATGRTRRAGMASRIAIAVQLDPHGLVVELRTIVTDRKLARLFDGDARPTPGD